MANLQVLTNPKLQKGVVENFLKDSRILTDILTNNPEQFSGSTVDRPAAISTSSVGGAFDGLAQMNRFTIDNEVRLKFTDRHEYEPIVLAQIDLDKNANDPAAAVRLEKYATQKAGRALKNRVGARIYGIGGTADVTSGNTGIVMEGLRTIIDDGSDNTLIGGQDRTVITALQATYYQAGATLNSTTYPNIGTRFNTASVGNASPTHIYTTKTLYNLFEGLITQTQFTNPGMISRGASTRTGGNKDMQGLAANVGFDGLFFKGRPIIGDDLCPANFMFMVNLDDPDALQWLGLKSTEEGAIALNLGEDQLSGPFFQDVSTSNMGMTLRKSVQSPNQYGKAYDILLMGCLASWNPRLNAKLRFS